MGCRQDQAQATEELFQWHGCNEVPEVEVASLETWSKSVLVSSDYRFLSIGGINPCIGVRAYFCWK